MGTEKSEVESAESPARSTWTRRRFLKASALGLIGSGATAGIYGSQFEPHWIDVVQRELPIENLPESLSGRTLIQISDLHIGPVVDDDYMRDALAMVSQLKPDILAITGDFMTYRSPQDLDKTISHLKDLEGGQLATVAIPGNHDFGHMFDDIALCDRLTDRLEGLNIRLLRNESTLVDGLRILGVNDMWGPFFNVEAALNDYVPSEASLALCHNPDAADRGGWGEYRGWILSGHTHGGQCRVPFFRPPILPVVNRRYVAGEVPVGDGRQIYINRGLGYLSQIRFAVRPEITIFTLRDGSQTV